MGSGGIALVGDRPRARLRRAREGRAFYLASSLFWLKLALFGAVLGLEIWPMLTLVRWRAAHRRGDRLAPAHVRALSVINHLELALVVVIVFVASFMARGFGLR